MTFVDTSALVALMDGDDARQPAVAAEFARVAAEAVTHNYVVVETEAVVHRRLGSDAARLLIADVLPALEVDWVDEALHRQALAAHLASLARRTSFVDHVSFELMRRRGLPRALALDEHFRSAGFDVVP